MKLQKIREKNILTTKILKQTDKFYTSQTTSSIMDLITNDTIWIAN
jgi:hypothetical protein